jgi:hypothetical protein
MAYDQYLQPCTREVAQLPIFWNSSSETSGSGTDTATATEQIATRATKSMAWDIVPRPKGSLIQIPASFHNFFLEKVPFKKNPNYLIFFIFRGRCHSSLFLPSCQPPHLTQQGRAN